MPRLKLSLEALFRPFGCINHDTGFNYMRLYYFLIQFSFIRLLCCRRKAQDGEGGEYLLSSMFLFIISFYLFIQYGVLSFSLLM